MIDSAVNNDGGKYTKKRGRLRCHKRPKSREETPKEGIGGKRLAAPQQYERAVHKKQGGSARFFWKTE
jgi:hypothetical protein